MRTAVIVAGVCRYSDIPSKTWDIFPFDADLYISTWDTTNDTYSNKLTNSCDEIEIIKRNTKNNKNTRLISINVSDYEDSILAGKIRWSLARPIFLLNEIYEKIKASKYSRIIYFRPDLYLTTAQDVELTADDFAVDDSSVKIVGMHESAHWVNHEAGCMEDHFFCMSRQIFEKFIRIFDVIDTREPDIHKIFYNFFKNNNLTLEGISKMRCVIVRKEIEEYYINTNEQPDLSLMMEIYFKAFSEKFDMVHEIKRNAIDLEFLDIDKRIIDTKLIDDSKNNGGILNKRDKQ